MGLVFLWVTKGHGWTASITSTRKHFHSTEGKGIIVSLTFSFTSNVGKAISPKAFGPMSEFPLHRKVFPRGTEAASVSITGAATQTTWALI